MPYGPDGSIPLDVPEGGLVLYPNEVPVSDWKRVIRDALEAASGPSSLTEFLRERKSLLVVVNDAARPTPTAKVLSLIRSDLKGVPHRLIVATGAHRSPTEEELETILGDLHTAERGNLIIHDARNPDEMVRTGTTSRGTEVLLNRAVLEADGILVIGSVEPHYFAGYTGGRKAFVPGLAAYSTIERNHSHAMSPDSLPLALEGNPVHDDMMDALTTIGEKPVFAIMTVLTGRGDIY
ncbi:DUF2088 domain-containing protein, partial [Candidatus Fermentibacterales bacterium]|nr:DUF2088 domain-containing protein [Candidatus Fermentibacterales bacterium]